MPDHDFTFSDITGPRDPLLGQKIAERYQIRRLLVKGGMGCVYEGTQEPLGRPIALKTTIPSINESLGVVTRRFFREAQLLGKLAHPNIVVLHDFGEWVREGEAPVYYLVMELLKGPTLRDELRARSRLSAARTIHISQQICSALHEAHTAGMLHRDLKPPNIMLVERGGDRDFVKVIDFGLVKQINTTLDEDITHTEMIVGSPLYMAPEQFMSKKITPSTEIYALGVMMYEMLSGYTPFNYSRSGEATWAELLLQHLSSPVPTFNELVPQVSIPRRLESIIRKCLAKKPEDRFLSMASLEDALKGLTKRDLTAKRFIPSSTSSPILRPPTPAPSFSPTSSRSAPLRSGSSLVPSFSLEHTYNSRSSREQTGSSSTDERRSVPALLLHADNALVHLIDEYVKKLGSELSIAATLEQAQQHLEERSFELIMISESFNNLSATHIARWVRHQTGRLIKNTPKLIALTQSPTSSVDWKRWGFSIHLFLPNQMPTLMSVFDALTLDPISRALRQIDHRLIHPPTIEEMVRANPEQAIQSINDFIGHAPEWIVHLSEAIDSADLVSALRYSSHFKSQLKRLGALHLLNVVTKFEATFSLSPTSSAVLTRMLDELEGSYIVLTRALTALRSRLRSPE